MDYRFPNIIFSNQNPCLTVGKLVSTLNDKEFSYKLENMIQKWSTGCNTKGICICYIS